MVESGPSLSRGERCLLRRGLAVEMQGCSCLEEEEEEGGAESKEKDKEREKEREAGSD